MIETGKHNYKKTASPKRTGRKRWLAVIHCVMFMKEAFEGNYAQNLYRVKSVEYRIRSAAM
jgi:hypothetical protein